MPPSAEYLNRGHGNTAIVSILNPIYFTNKPWTTEELNARNFQDFAKQLEARSEAKARTKETDRNKNITVTLRELLIFADTRAYHMIKEAFPVEDKSTEFLGKISGPYNQNASV